MGSVSTRFLAGTGDKGFAICEGLKIQRMLLVALCLNNADIDILVGSGGNEKISAVTVEPWIYSYEFSQYSP
jgi:hypothetical protein